METNDSVSIMSNEEKFNEKMNEYYKLKKTYETKLGQLKKNIMKNDSLSMREKKEQFKNQKVKCINCQRNVGSIFSSNDNNLQVICGDQKNPCDLRIKLNRGKFINLFDIVTVFEDGIKEVKEDIIKLKLNLLFNYEEEFTIIKKFKELKKNLNEDLESLVDFKKQLIEKTTSINNKELIEEKSLLFLNFLDTIKKLIITFNENNNIDTIKDIIGIYENDLKKLNNDLISLKYKYYEIENRNDKFYLIKKPYVLKDVLYIFKDPLIESFNYKNEVFNQVPSSEEKDNLSREDDSIQINSDSFDEANNNLEKTEKITNSTKEEILGMEKDEKIKLQSESDSEKIPDKKENKLEIKDNKIFLNDEEILDKNNHEKNKQLYDSYDTISSSKAYSLGYALEMIYVDNLKPELIAIDKETKKVFRVTFPDLKVEDKNNDKNNDKNDDSDDESIPSPPPTPPPTSPQTPPPTTSSRSKNKSK